MKEQSSIGPPLAGEDLQVHKNKNWIKGTGTGCKALVQQGEHVWSLPEERQTLQTPFHRDSLPMRQGAVHCSSTEGLSIHAALSTQEQPDGPLLLEAQGQYDIALVSGMVRKLVGGMAQQGKIVSEATKADAMGDALLAITQWRNRPHNITDPSDTGLSGAAYRAMVRSISSDNLGETVSISDFTEEDLIGSALPLPAITGDDTREDKATRLLFERARAARPSLLAMRIERLKALGGRGKRNDAIDRIHRAAILLLHGESLDKAADEAGFNSSGRVSPGDRLARAVRALGFRVQLNARQHETRERKAQPCFGAGLPLWVVRSWSFEPSACLPLQNGRGDKQRVPLLVRLTRARARAARAQARAQARAARLAKVQARTRARARAATRAAKAIGLYASNVPGAVLSWVDVINSYIPNSY